VNAVKAREVQLQTIRGELAALDELAQVGHFCDSPPKCAVRRETLVTSQTARGRSVAVANCSVDNTGVPRRTVIAVVCVYRAA